MNTKQRTRTKVKENYYTTNSIRFVYIRICMHHSPMWNVSFIRNAWKHVFFVFGHRHVLSLSLQPEHWAPTGQCGRIENCLFYFFMFYFRLWNCEWEYHCVLFVCVVREYSFVSRIQNRILRMAKQWESEVCSPHSLTSYSIFRRIKSSFQFYSVEFGARTLQQLHWHTLHLNFTCSNALAHPSMSFVSDAAAAIKNRILRRSRICHRIDIPDRRCGTDREEERTEKKNVFRIPPFRLNMDSPCILPISNETHFVGEALDIRFVSISFSSSSFENRLHEQLTVWRIIFQTKRRKTENPISTEFRFSVNK